MRVQDWTTPVVQAVAPGIHRIPLPLPGDGLKAVNVYAIEDGDGVTMIDGGWAVTGARERLMDALAALEHDLGDIRRFLVTHVHRDHYQLAIEVRRLLGANVLLGVGEQTTLKGLIRTVPWEQSPMADRLRSVGASELVRQLARAGWPSEDDMTDWEVPDTWLRHGDVLEAGDRELTVWATPGHTQGHVVFHDRDAGLLFAGDHVLPHITPSIGFEHVPVRSALGDYLASLIAVRGRPDCELFPAHGAPGGSVHARIDELLIHHDIRLRLSAQAVQAGARTAYEAAQLLPWTRRERRFSELDPFNRMLAVNETAAHLDVLASRDELGIRTDPDGVRHYLAS